jgi:hypothetical protein
MVTCEDCKQEMVNSKSCDKKYILIGDKWMKRDTTYYDVNEHCHDCGILNIKGNIHHFGCDIERCPKCKGQLLSCRCNKEVKLK